MNIFFHEEDRGIPDIDIEKIKTTVVSVCEDEGKKVGDINFIYCSDEYLLSINEKFLGHDYYTDIITFNYNDQEIIAGDIFMSRDRIEENAKKFGEELEIEFIRVCGHGIFHLLGQNDESDDEKAEMRRKEQIFIELING